MPWVMHTHRPLPLTVSGGEMMHTITQPGRKVPSQQPEQLTVDSALMLHECVQHHAGDHCTAGCAGAVQVL